MRYFRLIFLGFIILLHPFVGAAQSILVSPNGEVTSLTEAIRLATEGQHILIEPGVYVENDIVVDKPVHIQGQPGAILDGNEHPILLIKADSVTVEGLLFRNVGTSFVDDRAALKVDEGAHCRIKNNHFEDTFFAIYLAKTAHCEIHQNHIQGHKASESRSGNGIHLWYSKNITITENEVRGHRDGIYLEFVEDSMVKQNISEHNMRYGLHFMFSDRCSYYENMLRYNDAGVAVMYTKHVDIIGNTFEGNWGSAAYGLLLKDITDSQIQDNLFSLNTIGIYAEGSDRMEVKHNSFIDNGWALKIMANSIDNTFTENNFIANSFDVATNSRQNNSLFTGNYWDKYKGYDLDRDGKGDVPFRPVTLYSLMIEKNEPTIILLNSFFIELLNAAERVLPAITPETLIDHEPATERIL